MPMIANSTKNDGVLFHTVFDAMEAGWETIIYPGHLKIGDPLSGAPHRCSLYRLHTYEDVLLGQFFHPVVGNLAAHQLNGVDRGKMTNQILLLLYVSKQDGESVRTDATG